jgi:hypothetical protein
MMAVTTGAPVLVGDQGGVDGLQSTVNENRHPERSEGSADPASKPNEKDFSLRSE